MPHQPTFSYSTVTGYFLQSEAATVAQGFDYTSTNFGLIDRPYESDVPGEETRTQWQRFEHEVQRLNDTAGEGVIYKVLYLGRHGQGVHNVAEARYGREEWDRHYASLPGDAHGHWTDAHLTPTGAQQALAARAFWRHQIASAGTPAPQTHLTSPLYRCLETADLTFANLFEDEEKDHHLPLATGAGDHRRRRRPPYAYAPLVKELLREVLGVHTCDRRSAVSALRRAFPHFRFEASMPEEDELWSATHRETHGEVDARMRRLLDDVFFLGGGGDGDGDAATFVSFTSHSGAICSLLRVLGHREFRLVTGGVMPVLVRAERQ
ncbi:MAG: hypothetical protein LQ348_005445 [Seirophora lacunosa]|nr:MAG: hypothetical protein LQ348_005445 [Seirophora lacunosa]